MGLTRYTRFTLTREILLVLLALLWTVPFYYLTITSLKPTQEIFSSPSTLPSRWELGNYAEAWKSASVGRALVNSLIITGGSVILLIALGSLCAYAIARLPHRVGNLLYFVFALGIILPSQLGLIPMYSVMRSLGLLGSFAGIILLNTAIWLPMSVFFYSGFIRTLPKDYEEAAMIDGASLSQLFARVVFPLLRPVTGTVAIFVGMILWNDFFTPLIFLSGTQNTPLTVAVYKFVGDYATRWNLVFATVAMALAPAIVFFLFAQRQLIQGFSGGVKG